METEARSSNLLSTDRRVKGKLETAQRDVENLRQFLQEKQALVEPSASDRQRLLGNSNALSSMSNPSNTLNESSKSYGVRCQSRLSPYHIHILGKREVDGVGGGQEHTNFARERERGVEYIFLREDVDVHGWDRRSRMKKCAKRS